MWIHDSMLDGRVAGVTPALLWSFVFEHDSITQTKRFLMIMIE